MFTFIIGGSASGKSRFAEELVCGLEGRRIYLATMEPWDEECVQRIRRHQRMRAEKEFTTLECYRGLEKLSVPKESNVLLECMGNLLANEMFADEPRDGEAVLNGVLKLAMQCRHLTVVSDEVFSSGDRYEEGTRRYMRSLARINRALAARADRAAEVTCGLPVWLK